jgi:hypothetical protein
VPDTRGILMSYNRGPKARRLGRESEAAQLRFGLTTIEEVYPGIRKNYERGFVKVWDRDPWARGAIAYLLPGQVIVARTAHRKAGGKNPLRRRARVVAARLGRAHSSRAGERQPRFTLPEACRRCQNGG